MITNIIATIIIAISTNINVQGYRATPYYVKDYEFSRVVPQFTATYEVHKNTICQFMYPDGNTNILHEVVLKDEIISTKKMIKKIEETWIDINTLHIEVTTNNINTHSNWMSNVLGL